MSSTRVALLIFSILLSTVVDAGVCRTLWETRLGLKKNHLVKRNNSRIGIKFGLAGQKDEIVFYQVGKKSKPVTIYTGRVERVPEGKGLFGLSNRMPRSVRERVSTYPVDDSMHTFPVLGDGFRDRTYPIVVEEGTLVVDLKWGWQVDSGFAHDKVFLLDTFVIPKKYKYATSAKISVLPSPYKNDPQQYLMFTLGEGKKQVNFHGPDQKAETSKFANFYEGDGTPFEFMRMLNGFPVFRLSSGEEILLNKFGQMVHLDENGALMAKFFYNYYSQADHHDRFAEWVMRRPYIEIPNQGDFDWIRLGDTYDASIYPKVHVHKNKPVFLADGVLSKTDVQTSVADGQFIVEFNHSVNKQPSSFDRPPTLPNQRFVIPLREFE